MTDREKEEAAGTRREADTDRRSAGGPGDDTPTEPMNRPAPLPRPAPAPTPPLGNAAYDAPPTAPTIVKPRQPLSGPETPSVLEPRWRISPLVAALSLLAALITGIALASFLVSRAGTDVPKTGPLAQSRPRAEPASSPPSRDSLGTGAPGIDAEPLQTPAPEAPTVRERESPPAIAPPVYRDDRDDRENGNDGEERWEEGDREREKREDEREREEAKRDAEREREERKWEKEREKEERKREKKREKRKRDE